MSNEDCISSRRRFALYVVRRLQSVGFEAVWAGGCVRDRLLGREPRDYDVATNAIPAEIRGIFRGHKTLNIGAAFGVVAIIGPGGAGKRQGQGEQGQGDQASLHFRPSVTKVKLPAPVV
ncbi:MAG: CCA tRNA nucleotidyltransferase [Proteobacteria bacterium]|nr:CCA tRNA nucleotidyltransferase [Pseudomonadota bacterium]